MKRLFDKFITERHHLVLEEDDVIGTLKVIQKHHRVLPDVRVGNCGWKDENKWFIHFTTSRARWKTIRNELKVVRVFENLDIPENTIGVVYSTD